MAKWSWSLRFFAIFVASGVALLTTVVVWLIYEAYRANALIGTTTAIGLLCIASFLLYLVADEYEKSQERKTPNFKRS